MTDRLTDEQLRATRRTTAKDCPLCGRKPTIRCITDSDQRIYSKWRQCACGWDERLGTPTHPAQPAESGATHPLAELIAKQEPLGAEFQIKDPWPLYESAAPPSRARRAMRRRRGFMPTTVVALLDALEQARANVELYKAGWADKDAHLQRERVARAEAEARIAELEAKFDEELKALTSSANLLNESADVIAALRALLDVAAGALRYGMIALPGGRTHDSVLAVFHRKARAARAEIDDGKPTQAMREVEERK